MGPPLKLLILVMITSVPIGKADRDYEVIHFRVPQEVWRQAFDPTPVLRSPVTITVPVSIEDESENELEDDVGDVEIESQAPVLEDPVLSDPVISDPVTTEQNVTQVVEEVATENNTTPATQAPVQDEVVTESPTQNITGQVERFPCACRRRQCGCCTGATLERYRMKACGNITFNSEDLTFDVRMSVNNNTVVRRRVSASDPPPICFNPRRAPFVRVCAEISNIRILNQNAHACLDIDADIAGFPIYSASFRCFSMGSSGIKTGLKPRPPSSGPKPVNLFGSGNSEGGGGGGGGFFQNIAGGVFGGGSSNSNEDEGPFSAIGDAIGDFFDGS